MVPTRAWRTGRPSGSTLYLTNAHFTAADPANTEYAITAIPDPA
jgi:hypothetical protein